MNCIILYLFINFGKNKWIKSWHELTLLIHKFNTNLIVRKLLFHYTVSKMKKFVSLLFINLLDLSYFVYEICLLKLFSMELGVSILKHV